MTAPEIALRKLSTLRDHLARLARRRPATAAEFGRDLDLQDAIAMSLVVCVQTALDIAMHIAADDKLGVPATYADAFRVLSNHGLLDADTSTRLEGMAALRNRIAHGYASVDFERIWRELPAGIEAFSAFSTVIAKYLAKPGA